MRKVIGLIGKLWLSKNGLILKLVVVGFGVVLGVKFKNCEFSVEGGGVISIGV